MVKLLIISLMFVSLFVAQGNAQAISKDSVVKIAYTDAQKFKLGNAELKRFQKDKNNGHSDFFKPRPVAVSDTAFLADSAYVSAYRIAAYNRTVKRRTVGHYFLVGGVVYIAASIAAAFVLLLVVFAKAGK